VHPDQSRTGCKRCVRENEKADGHRPEFEAVVGGSSRHQVMTTYREELELMDDITQQQNNAAEGRAKELLTQYFSTDDADIQLINASDLFKEFGKVVEP
jgi:hypothetical protein